MRDKEENLPKRNLIVSNAGVRVFFQESLILKPGRRYVLVTETEEGRHYENPDDGGLKHYWVIVDFEKGSSPILPSRLEIDIEQEFSRALLDIIYDRFCEGLRSVVHELAGRANDDKTKRKAVLSALCFSTVDARSWRNEGDPSGFSRVKIVEQTAIALYKQYCPIPIEALDGEIGYSFVTDLEGDPGGIFVIDSVAKSALFSVYARASGLKRWVVVESRREYFLFNRAISNPEWKGFVSEKSLYSEGRYVFSESTESPLTDVLRADYALIRDDIFNGACFIVLPSSLPGAWKRSEAAGSSRRDSSKSCPARVLVNCSHQLSMSVEEFLRAEGTTAEQRKTLKLLFENLCDGVIEQDRRTVARERWRALSRELRDLLGTLREMRYEALVVRR